MARSREGQSVKRVYTAASAKNYPSIQNLFDWLGRVDQRQDSVQHGQDERADYASFIAAATAEDGSPADDDRCDGRQ